MTAAITGRSFDMGRVVERTFKTISANPMTFGGITVLLVCLPQELLALVQNMVLGGSQTVRAEAGLLTLPISLGSFFSSLVAQAALIYATITYLNGRSPPMAECLSKGLPHWWKLFCVSLITGFGVVLASILFLVPGFILLTRWLIAPAAQVMENTGARASLGRSAELTKGNRWAIFGLLICYSLIIVVIEVALVALGSGFRGSFVGALNQPLFRFGIGLFQLIIVPLATSGIACIYYELRGGREGVEFGNLAAVFE